MQQQEAVTNQLRGRLRHHAGAEIKLSRPVEDKNPVVIGRLRADPSLPTVTFYGHYDVQPAMEREWASDPFELAAIDGYLYGRGTSDNKVRILWCCAPAWLGLCRALHAVKTSSWQTELQS